MSEELPVEELLPGEIEQLEQFDRKNKQASFELANRTLDVEQAKAALEDSTKNLFQLRREFSAYYHSVLKAHGIAEGDINLEKKYIVVKQRKPSA